MIVAYSWQWWRIRPRWKPYSPPWSETNRKVHFSPPSDLKCLSRLLGFELELHQYSPAVLWGWTEAERPQTPSASSGLSSPSPLTAARTPSLTELNTREEKKKRKKKRCHLTSVTFSHSHCGFKLKRPRFKHPSWFPALQTTLSSADKSIKAPQSVVVHWLRRYYWLCWLCGVSICSQTPFLAAPHTEIKPEPLQTFPPVSPQPNNNSKYTESVQLQLTLLRCKPHSPFS